MRDREFFSNRHRALELSPAASRRTIPRPGGPLRSVDAAPAAYKDLQSGFQVLYGLINNLCGDGIVLVPGSQFWPRSEE